MKFPYCIYLVHHHLAPRECAILSRFPLHNGIFVHMCCKYPNSCLFPLTTACLLPHQLLSAPPYYVIIDTSGGEPCKQR
jgi:hypothetical protein